MSDVHVVPMGDLVAHEVSDECLCGPQVALVPARDGGCNWLVVHHSLLDGRKVNVESG